MARPLAGESGAARRVPTTIWVLPLVAVVLLPGLGRIAQERPHLARVEQASLMTVIVICAALLLFAAFFYGSGRRLRWSLGMTAIGTLVLFHWPNLTTGGEIVVDVVPFAMLRDIVPVALATALLWLAARLAAEPGFAIVSSISLWVVALLLVAMTAPYFSSSATTTTATAATPGSPDVLLIILDGYPRADVLRSGFAFDNSGFLAELETRGFYVAEEAQSNYSYTYGSVSAMFAMDYLLDLGPVDNAERKAVSDVLGGDSPLVRRFHDNGYTVTFFENAWEGSRCGPTIDRCIRDGLLERAVWNVSQLTILAPVFEIVRPDPFISVSLNHLKKLGNTVTEPATGSPVLTIAHFILPHPPNLVDAECRINISAERRRSVFLDEAHLEERRQFVTEQVTCVNDLLLGQLDQILSNDDETVIMITGDHGYTSTVVEDTYLASHSPRSAMEQMSPLSAYRLPDCEGLLYPTITPVNGVRATTACALNHDFERLDDISRWVNLHGDRTVRSLDGLLP